MASLLLILHYNLTGNKFQTKAHIVKSWMDEPYVSNFEVSMMKLKDFIKFMRVPHNFSSYDPDVRMQKIHAKLSA
jgi:hypothetical protein